MKSSIGFSALLLVLVFGCTKDQSITSPAPDDQIQKPSDMYAISFSGNPQYPVKTISWEEIQKAGNTSSGKVQLRSSSSSVNGHFSPIANPNDPDDLVIVSLSGVLNNGGVHGHARIKSSFLDFSVNTECLLFDGNEVVYGGVITQVFYVDPAFIAVFGDIIVPDAHIALKMKDNGEGQNAPADQTTEYFIVGPFPLCDAFPPESDFWTYVFPLVDVLRESDQIQVSN
ncbi:MAG TPA: hypothetical protein VI603_09965 [Saprospiraceae bacterium]|nr:hypothetical protein [Saprospiraceae bacterium]